VLAQAGDENRRRAGVGSPRLLPPFGTTHGAASAAPIDAKTHSTDLNPVVRQRRCGRCVASPTSTHSDALIETPLSKARLERTAARL